MSIETALNRLKQAGIQPSDGRAPAQPPYKDTSAVRLSSLAPPVAVRFAELRGDDGDGYLPLISPELAEQLRQLRRPLVARALGRLADRVEQGQIVLVTSSIAGEGKTFCSLNLAISLAAERDFDVLLVDADLTNPTLSKRLGLEGRPGLADTIRAGKEHLNGVILGTDVPGLYVMGAGTRDGQEAELIAGGKLHEIVGHLASGYRDLFVLFDSAPLHETSGARALATLVGQVLLVVRAGLTPRKIVMQALDLLDGVDPVIVLNQVTSAQPPAYGSPYTAAPAAPRLQLENRPGGSDLL